MDYDFKGRDSFPPSRVGRIDKAIAGLPEPVRDYLLSARVPIIYLPTKEIENMPPSLRGQLRFAKAVAWNKSRINIPEEQLDLLDSSDLAHELTHMAYDSLPVEARKKAMDQALGIGQRIVTFARQKKHDPEDEVMCRGAARHMASLTRRTIKGKPANHQFAHELTLAIPPYQYREIAGKLGIKMPADDQYAAICVDLYLSERNHLDLFPGEEQEEIVAYLAGSDPEYAASTFLAGKDKLAKHAQEAQEREGRMDAWKIQVARSPMAQQVDRLHLARNVVPYSQVARWKKHPGRMDIEGIDTPPRLSR